MPPQTQLALPSSPTAAERRASPRESLLVSGWVRRGHSIGRIPVRLYDRSVGGVSFTAAIAFKPGEKVELTYQQADTRQFLQLEIAFCEFISGDTFRIGAHEVAAQ